MGYEFFCGIPVAVVAVLALVLGLFLTLARLEDWVAKQINKNRETVGVHKARKEYKYSFSTVKHAAANAIERVRKMKS